MQRPMLPQLRETSDFHAPPADFNPMQRRIALDYKARADWTMQPTTKCNKIRMQWKQDSACAGGLHIFIDCGWRFPKHWGWDFKLATYLERSVVIG